MVGYLWVKTKHFVHRGILFAVSTVWSRDNRKLVGMTEQGKICHSVGCRKNLESDKARANEKQ